MLVALVALGVALSGGTQAAPVPAPAGFVEHTLVVAGQARTYRTVAPRAGHDLPLLVVLHGRGQSPQATMEQTGFLGLVRKGRAALAFPDGIGRSWDAGGGCCGLAGARAAPDGAFVAAVVGAALHELPVDPSRVYLVGYSNGGKLAYAVACAHPGLIAAVATYGAVPLAPCPGGTPLPYLLAAGELDAVMPFTGAPRQHPPLPSVRTAVAWLRAQDGCTGAPTEVTVGAAVVQHWTACRPGSEVTFVRYPLSGHTWPTSGIVGEPAAAATVMWSFLDAQTG